MCQALLRRSLLVLVALAAFFGGRAANAQSFDPNIVSRVDSFIPPPQQTVLPTKTQKVPVKKTEEVTVTVTEKKDLTLEEREAKAKDWGSSCRWDFVHPPRAGPISTCAGCRPRS